MRYYTYKIIRTNALLDETYIYIGSKGTSKSEVNDNYMGSSEPLDEAISEHGINNFKKEILEYYTTREEAFEAETELHIENNVAKNPLYYNQRNANAGFRATQLSAKKSVETLRNKIDENGLNGLVSRANNTHTTLRNKIDKNGMNGHNRLTKKAMETLRNKIDKNGMNGHQQNRIKSNNTLREDIDESGLNGLQRKKIKANNTMRNDIDKDGLNGIERAINKQSNTILENKKQKWPKLYNKQYFLEHCLHSDGALKFKELSKKFNISWYILKSIKEFHNMEKL